MKQTFYFLIPLISFWCTGISQNIAGLRYGSSVNQQNNRPVSVTSSGFSGTGANIDVIYHKISWRINPDSAIKYIKGYVQTNFKTIQNNVNSISFDLNTVLTVDSVRFHGALLPAGNITRPGNTIVIALSATLSINTIDSVWIYYEGTPPAVSGSAEGYQKATSSTAGNYIYSL